jgi:hypothetical protein
MFTHDKIPELPFDATVFSIADNGQGLEFSSLDIHREKFKTEPVALLILGAIPGTTYHFKDCVSRTKSSPQAPDS